MIQFKVPEKCIDCLSIRLIIPAGGHYCAAHITNPELDISTNAVDPESRPEWCPIDKMNESIRGMTPEKREAFKKVAEGMSVLFEGSGFGTGLEFIEAEEPNDESR